MARQPNSSNTTENTEESVDSDVQDVTAANAESSADEPIIIDADDIETAEDAADGAETRNSDDSSEKFPAAERSTGRSVVPLIIGGLLAGAIGVFAGYMATMQGPDEEFASLSSSVESNAAGLAGISDKLNGLQEEIPEPVDLSGIDAQLKANGSAIEAVTQDLTGVTNGINELRSDLAALALRVEALEVQSGNTSSSQAAAAEEQLKAFRADLDRLVSEAEAKVAEADAKAAEIEAAAAEAARQAEREAALAELRAAIDSGAPFANLLGDDAPPALTDHAETGVPALVLLQQDFPKAARAALATAQTVPADASTSEKLSAFLKRQTNARSLQPRDGNDADAVLSRAEASLAGGDLSGALGELAGLPETAQSAMETWLDQAKRRDAAVQAVNSLSDSMN